MNKKNIIIGLVAIILIVIGIFLNNKNNSAIVSTQNNQTNDQNLITSVSFSCDDDKTIQASFYEGATPPKVEPGQPPIPTGSVKISLSDGRALDIPQAISADGARYATSNDAIVFWNKGKGAFITENNEKTYSGCIQLAEKTDSLSNVYENSKKGFSILYPNGFTVDKDYTYQEAGPGKSISGVKFTIPSSMASGTNLSSDSYLSVEELPQASNCSATLFSYDNSEKATEVTDGDTIYSYLKTGDAGAGNRYDEFIYAIPGTNPCIALRYFIHYGVFENYPAGTVTKFDEKALTDTFDQIRHSLIVSSQ